MWCTNRCRKGDINYSNIEWILTEVASGTSTIRILTSFSRNIFCHPFLYSFFRTWFNRLCRNIFRTFLSLFANREWTPIIKDYRWTCREHWKWSIYHMDDLPNLPRCHKTAAHLWSIKPPCLSGCLSVCLFVHLSDCLSIWFSVYLSCCLSVCPFVCLSVCLSPPPAFLCALFFNQIQFLINTKTHLKLLMNIF